jgi:Rieske Fe-S protein
MTRREFVTVVTACVGGIMGAVIGLPAIEYLISPATKTQKSESWIPLGPLDKIPVGVPTPFSFTRSKVTGWEETVNSYGVYVIRSEDNQVRVLSNVCTHLACRVTWRDDLKEYVCPCHDGRFDVDGNVTNGPPPRPLDLYDTKIDESGNLLILFGKG